MAPRWRRFCSVGVVVFLEAQSENQHQTACAMAAKEQVASVSMAKMVTVDDLTRGSVNYKCLGLDFEKADFEGLRYVCMCYFYGRDSYHHFLMFHAIIFVEFVLPNWIQPSQTESSRFAWKSRMLISMVRVVAGARMFGRL